MNERQRRQRRLIAGSLVVLVAAGLAYALRSAVTAHAQPARTLARVHAIAPVLAPPPHAGVRSHFATSANGRHPTPSRTIRSSTAQAGVRSSTARAGVPAPPPSPRGVSQALKQTTGLTPAQVTSRPVCARAAPGHASCAAQTLVLRSTGAPVRPRIVPSSGHATPAAGASANPPEPATPAYLQQAYDLTSLAQTGGSGDTVAIVDAYDDPTAEQDLATYRSTYQLPACTTANGCFQKVGQNGSSSSLPAPNASWEQEIALDLDAVSAVCPQCHILLVEANSSSFSDLQAAMQTAAGLGAKQISASWGGVSSGVPAGFRTFTGVATVAATGDYGYVGAGEDQYPAALPGVTAAGGTSLAPAGAPSARGFGEGAWSWDGLTGGGSGCDLQFHRPVYQPAAGCAGRAYADLSADADPNTGLAVYSNGSWSMVGGTSLSTPLIAAYYAITGVAGATPQWAYGAGSSLNDVVSGSTGNCAAGIAYICNAGRGYDGPTGMGSISGSAVTGAPGIGGPTIGGGASNTYTQSVSDHGATIAGGIYRNGLDTSWSIQYGTTTGYGIQTPASDIGAGSAPVAVTGYLSQLTPGTTYHYRLVAQNSLGTTYGYDYTLTTSAPATAAPTAAFAVPTGTQSPGSPVSFDASGSAPASGASSISDYRWNFGDGTAAVDSGTSATTSHTFAQRGTYTVTLTVTSNGQTDTSTQTVTVDAAPAAAFTPAAAAVPAGTTVKFSAGTSKPATGGSITDYSWNFGDGTPAVDAGTAATAGHTFTTPGVYTVTLTVTDDLDVSTTATEQVTVAAFTASPAIPLPGSPVTFTAVGPNAAAGAQYTWNFGDGNTSVSTSPSVTHTYSALGSYQVALTIQNSGEGATGSDGTAYSGTAALSVDTPPTAAFTPSATAVLPGTTMNFDASASKPATGGSITDYSWDFGDGTQPVDPGVTPTTHHTFSTPGVYTVTLTATDGLGGAATTSQQVTVDQPTAAFTVSTTNPTPTTTVTFDASGATDPESSITGYRWDFGDHTAGGGQITTHSFSQASTYTVRLTVTDQFGFTASTTQQVVVTPASAPTPPPPTTTSPPPSSAPPPVSSPMPPPPASPPSASPPPPTPAPAALAVKLTGAGRHRLAQALAHSFRFGLTINQAARASFQITVPVSRTNLARSARHPRNATVVLAHGAWAIAAGSHTITWKLSRATASRLATVGPVVLTVHVTVLGAGGKITRTVKLTLTH